MIKIRTLICLLFLASFVSEAQFKSELDKKDNIFESIEKPQSNLLLGIFNPENFSMKHSYQLMYSSFGVSGMALGMYTNSMNYKFTDNLNARVDISLAHSPFGSYNKNITDKFTGIFISRADLNYKPFDNFSIQLKFRQIPSYGYNPYLYNNSGWGYDPFYDDEFRR